MGKLPPRLPQFPAKIADFGLNWRLLTEKEKNNITGRNIQFGTLPIPSPKASVGVKIYGVQPPKIEDFYQQFMESFLASSAETVFHRNDLQEVHTVIDDEEMAQNGEILAGGGRVD